MEAYYPVDHLPLEFSLGSKISLASASRAVWAALNASSSPFMRRNNFPFKGRRRRSTVWCILGRRQRRKGSTSLHQWRVRARGYTTLYVCTGSSEKKLAKLRENSARLCLAGAYQNRVFFCTSL